MLSIVDFIRDHIEPVHILVDINGEGAATDHFANQIANAVSGRQAGELIAKKFGYDFFAVCIALAKLAFLGQVNDLFVMFRKEVQGIEANTGDVALDKVRIDHVTIERQIDNLAVAFDTRYFYLLDQLDDEAQQ